jgi:hypothetical protein
MYFMMPLSGKTVHLKEYFLRPLKQQVYFAGLPAPPGSPNAKMLNFSKLRAKQLRVDIVPAKFVSPWLIRAKRQIKSGR